MSDYFTDPKPELPQHIVLEINQALKVFQNQLNTTEHLGFDLEHVLADVLEDLMQENDAEHNVTITCHEVESEHADTELASDVIAYAQARQQFSLDLLRTLREYRLYVQGFLYYQLRGVVKSMMVLEKLNIPLTELNRHERRLARQADIAYRHYRPRSELEAEAQRLAQIAGELQALHVPACACR